MEEQTIFFNNNIYKIVKITNKYICVNELKIDYKLKQIKNKIHDYEEYICKYLRMLNIDDEIFIHFSNEINPAKKFKITKNKFINYIIIDNIDDVYLYNNKLMHNYHDWFKQSWDLQSKYSMKFNILLLTNQAIKDNLFEFRKNELFEFIFSYCGSYKKDIDLIKELDLYNEYLILKEEAEKDYFKDKELIKNTECPVCFENDINVYKNFYECNHGICYKCFSNWVDINHQRTCPLCRAKII